MAVHAVQLGQVEQGLRELNRALQIHQQAGDSSMLPLTMTALGQTYMALGQIESARSSLEQALERIVQLKALPRIAALEAPVRQMIENLKTMKGKE